MVGGADDVVARVPAMAAAEPADADVVVAIEHDWDPVGVPRGSAPDGIDVDESYRVDRIGGGRLCVRAGSAVGAFRGLTTIEQAVDRTAGAGVLPLFEAEDAPRWRWRGLCFDAVRAEYSPEELRRVVDLLAAYKLNVLHVHLTDSQAWRIEMPSYPALTPAGSTAYSRDELAALGAYAAERHVTIVPEIDMPGHTHAALAAYPELTGDEPFAHRYLAHLRPSVPAAMTFAREAVELLCGLFPGRYVHVGGDEALGADPDEYREFVRTVTAWVREHGKSPIAWQEATRADALGPGEIVQMWISRDDAFTVEMAERISAAVPELHDALVEMATGSVGDADRALAGPADFMISSSDPFYLDRRYAEPSVDPVQTERARALGNDGYPPRSTSALYDARSEFVATAERAGRSGRIAGFEAAIWAETIDDWNDLSMLLLPRLAMLSETMWGAAPPSWSEHADRLRRHGERWDALGFGNYYRSSDIF